MKSLKGSSPLVPNESNTEPRYSNCNRSRWYWRDIV